MKLIRSSNKVSDIISDSKLKGKSIGFVPTMGFLHQGHISLIRKARKENDLVVVSIFVNPIQFGPNEDFKKYPRDIERDLALINAEATDIAFYPDADRFYSKGFQTFVDVEKLGNVMCGLHRPGHFKGVCTVCAKLFNVVKPDRAYFGQKDYQQVLIIKRMVSDLNMDIKIRVLPIVREKDGLAMSSRNTYLSEEERQKAVLLYRSLCLARELIKSGERKTAFIKSRMLSLFSGCLCSGPEAPPTTDGRSSLLAANAIKIDYITVADADNLQEEKIIISRKTIVAIAAWVGKTRLIDNIIVKTVDSRFSR
ncbi:MAG: pantoate--beta-alanine ligase [Candidatus Omnitrophota bacterium]